VHAEAKKQPGECCFSSRRPAGGVYLIGSIVAFSWISPVLASSVINPVCVSLIEPFSYAYFAAGNISVGFTP
jgi:hypothetical protein